MQRVRMSRCVCPQITSGFDWFGPVPRPPTGSEIVSTVRSLRLLDTVLVTLVCVRFLAHRWIAKVQRLSVPGEGQRVRVLHSNSRLPADAVPALQRIAEVETDLPPPKFKKTSSLAAGNYEVTVWRLLCVPSASE